MKILYITADGFDTPNPNNQMAEVMINDFLRNGHSVHLIQSHKKGINPDIPTSLLNRSNFTFDTVKRKVVEKTKFIKRYLNDIRYAFSSMKYWRKVKDVDVVYLQSYPTVVYLMLLLKIFKRCPIVYSIYDVFPGHAYDIGVIKNKGIYNILKFIQKPCYKIPKSIAVLSEDMRNIVIKEGAKPDRVHIVPAWFDVKTAKEIPVEENRFIKKYNIDTNKFYVQFAGTIGYVFNYHTVIEVAKRLKHNDSIQFQMIGEGNVKTLFIEEVEKQGLDNITFYPLQPVELVPDVYSACDLALIPLMKGVIGNGVPSKAPILMACKRPIVNSVEVDSYYAKIFKENDMGIAVDITDYDQLARSIEELYNNPERRKRMAENAYDYGQENYSSVLSTKKLMDIFECVRKK